MPFGAEHGEYRRLRGTGGVGAGCGRRNKVGSIFPGKIESHSILKLLRPGITPWDIRLSNIRLSNIRVSNIRLSV
jgi:hypothetical protein